MAKVLEAGRRRLWQLLGPELVLEKPRHVVLNDASFARSLSVIGYPREVHADWLDRVRCLPVEMRISHYVEPVDSQVAASELARSVHQLRSRLLWSDRSQGGHSAVEDAELADTIALQQELARGTTHLFRHTLTITIRATSLEDLERTSDLVRTELTGQLFVVRMRLLEQARAFCATLPGGAMDLAGSRNMDSEAMAATLPWFGEGTGALASGEVWGMDAERHRLVVVDRFAQCNPHSVIIATSGAGKSFFLKSLLTQVLLQGQRAVVLDPQGEYGPWCEAMNGVGVRLGFGEGATSLQLIPLPSEARADGRLARLVIGRILEGLMEVLGPPLVPSERHHLSRVVDLWTEESGGQLDVAPTLAEWAQLLDAGDATKTGLAERLRTALSAGLACVDGRWLLPEDASLLVFDLRGILDRTPQLLPAVSLMLSELVLLLYVRPNRPPLLIAVDEAHHLLLHAPGARLLEQLYRTGRKRGVAVSLVTQSVGDLTAASGLEETVRACRAVLANASMVFLMRQQNAQEASALCRLYRLPDQDVERLLAFGRGEGLALVDGQRAFVQVEAPEALRELFGSSGSGPMEPRQRPP